MSMITLFSPAKVNLFFSVIKKRSDGYHEIASLYQAISLGDTLSISLSGADSFSCSSRQVPIDKSNLILQAVDLFRKKTRLSYNVEIFLDKRIPIGGGLGGGSSNAATTLWGLNHLLKTHVSDQQLAMWGGELGSDVPFFFSHGTAYCQGRGEKVQNVDISPPFSQGWIVAPLWGISTKEVYGATSVVSSYDPRDLLQSFYTPAPIFSNDLEKGAFLIDPRLQKMKEELGHFYERVTMTGSGASFLCLNETKKLQQYQKYCINPIQRNSKSWYCMNLYKEG